MNWTKRMYITRQLLWFYFINCSIFPGAYFSARSSRRFHLELCWWWEALVTLSWGFAFSAFPEVELTETSSFLVTPVELTGGLAGTVFLLPASNYAVAQDAGSCWYALQWRLKPALVYHIQMQTSCPEIHWLGLGGTFQISSRRLLTCT